MRLTTKIIIGIILSIFILSILTIIGFSFSDRKNYNTSHNRSMIIPQKNKIALTNEPFKVIVIETEEPDSENTYYYFFSNKENGLFINPATTVDDENKLFAPESFTGCISAHTNNDTLILKIKLDELRRKYGIIDEKDVKIRPHSRFYVTVTGLNLYWNMSNVDVINKLNGLQTRISNLETDSIKINSLGDVTIDYCKASVIEPVTKQQLTISNCTAQVLNFDLDRLNNWKTESCNIKVTNFTGSKNANLKYDNSVRGTLNWIPKNKDGEVTLTIKGETSLELKQPPSQDP